VAAKARKRGYYTREEFLLICRWKTPRSKPLVESNSAEAVEAATREAFAASDEERRIESLLSLRGVSWTTASALLHLPLPDLYPILDKRVLHALGARPNASVSLKSWLDYVDAWREVVAESGLDGRSADQGLWQWSKEQGVPLY
jgi:hypothetical protein